MYYLHVDVVLTWLHVLMRFMCSACGVSCLRVWKTKTRTACAASPFLLFYFLSVPFLTFRISRFAFRNSTVSKCYTLNGDGNEFHCLIK